VQLACAIQPATAFPGDPLTVTATATNLNPKRKATYSWDTNGGTISGTDSSVTIYTTGVAPGAYAVNGHIVQGVHVTQQASCTASFTLQPFAPPSIACSANPSSLNIGDTATITAKAVSPQNRTLTYSYQTTAGTVTGNTPAVTLATSGAAPGTITVSCNVVDDLGKTATATTNVTVLAPPQPAAPETRNLCAITFNSDNKRPVRVDNEAKACLDDVALELQRESADHLVIVGNFAAGEQPEAGADRALNVRQYLTDEKGIDASRIDVRVGSDAGRTATNVLVPAGATFAADGSSEIDTSVHTHGEPYGKPRP
jgi:outer membrane protein OmpA-like peptidoglycan-associated protein